ncbi:MAG: hypothetical protein AB1746_06165 [Candidatus Zixiibacteriota bacterium]
MTRNWTCPTSEMLDQYILGSAQVDRRALEEHVQECALCRFYVDKRKGQFQEIQDSWRIEQESRVIRLYPVENTIYLIGDSESRLAAKGFADSEPNSSITLASPNKEILLRVVRDHRTHDVWLYLIAEDKEKYLNALVKPFGINKEFLADERGRIKLGQIEWPIKENLTAEILLPKATFNMFPIEGGVEKTGTVELKSSDGDRIQVTVSGKGRARRLDIKLLDVLGLAEGAKVKIAMRTDRATHIMPIGYDQKGETTLENIGESDRIEIYLFH